MSPIRRVRVTAFACTCARCGRQVVVLKVPDRCPSCKAHFWLRPPLWKKPASKKKRRAPKG